MTERLLKEFTREERNDWDEVVGTTRYTCSLLRANGLYFTAYRIENMLIENGAVAGEDYTILDLMKLATEWEKAVNYEPPSMCEVSESLDNVSDSLDKIADALKKK